jgi:hypothetical protein
MQDLICTVKMKGDGREYSASPDLNAVLGDLRKQAGDLRLGANMRARAVIALAVADGFLPDTELDDSVTSTYLKSLITTAQPESEVKPVAIDYAERIRIALAAAETGGSNGLLQMEHQPS